MRELMSPPSLVDEPEQTKSKILMESIHMFALSGYHKVSVREIAQAIGLQPGSIYNYFLSKQDILENIMKLAEDDLHSFYNMLDGLSEEAATFRQLLDNIFLECKRMANPNMMYAIYCAMQNQFELECCRHTYYDVYFKEGHTVMRRQLETAIRRKLVEPFHVPEVAATITNCFVSMVGFTVAHLNGFYGDFDPVSWYETQICHILRLTGMLDEGDRDK